MSPIMIFAGQRGPLVLTDVVLPAARHELPDRRVVDVAEEVLRVHEVVAGVQVTVVIQGQAQPAGLVEDAHPGLAEARPVAGRGLEGLHVDASDVVAHPFVEDGIVKIGQSLR